MTVHGRMRHGKRRVESERTFHRVCVRRGARGSGGSLAEAAREHPRDRYVRRATQRRARGPCCSTVAPPGRA
eukprot:2160079-Prymnesium_polylepis.2